MNSKWKRDWQEGDRFIMGSNSGVAARWRGATGTVLGPNPHEGHLLRVHLDSPIDGNIFYNRVRETNMMFVESAPSPEEIRMVYESLGVTRAVPRTRILDILLEGVEQLRLTAEEREAVVRFVKEMQ